MAEEKRKVGRPKGSVSLKKMLRTAIALEREGIHPALELARLAKTTKDEFLKKEIFCFLHTYCDVVPKEIEPDSPDDEGDEHDTAALEEAANQPDEG